MKINYRIINSAVRQLRMSIFKTFEAVLRLLEAEEAEFEARIVIRESTLMMTPSFRTIIEAVGQRSEKKKPDAKARSTATGTESWVRFRGRVWLCKAAKRSDARSGCQH